MAEHQGRQGQGGFIAYPTDTLFGVVDRREDAEAALRARADAGFPQDAVSVLRSQCEARSALPLPP